MGPDADPIERPRSPTPQAAVFAPISGVLEQPRGPSPVWPLGPFAEAAPQASAAPRTPSPVWEPEAPRRRLAAAPRVPSPVRDPELVAVPLEGGAAAIPAPEAAPAKPGRFYKRHPWTTALVAFAVLGTITLSVALGVSLTRPDNDDKKKTGPVPTPANPAVPTTTSASITSATIGTSATSRPTVVPATTTSAPGPTATPTVGELENPTTEPQPGPGDAGVATLNPLYVALFPAGLPTNGDVNPHGIPDEGAATALNILAFGYPRFLQSVVAPVPGSITEFAVNMRAPNGTPIVVVVDNKFVTSNNGTLLQLGSMGGNANWATVMQKAVGKAKDLFGMGGKRTAYFNMANMTESDVFNFLLPNGQLTGIAPTDRKGAIAEGVYSLNTTFNGLVSTVKPALTPSFEGALTAIEDNNATALRSNLAVFGAVVNENKLAGVGAFDVLVSGLSGVGAWVEGFI